MDETAHDPSDLARHCRAAPQFGLDGHGRGHGTCRSCPRPGVFVPIDLALVLPRPKGPIPAVTGTSGQTGRCDVAGRSRVVHLSDGRQVREEITASDPSDGQAPRNGRAGFAYRVHGFTGPFGLLAREARASWAFAETAPGP
ncbi:MAG: hypothetical protein ACK4GO_10835 [Gemmobacter sp.]